MIREEPPYISIVMPLYNKEREVARAIGSVLAQTWGDYELVVIDDGSTDGGAAVVGTFTDPRLRLVSQANAGVSAARNRGIAESRAGLIAFLDADDEWLPEFLETVLRLHKNFPSCRVFATSYLLRSADGSMRPAYLTGIPASLSWEGILDDYFTMAAASDPPLWTSAVVVEKSALQTVGGFPEGIRSGEDLLTWARLAIRFPIAYSRYHGAIFWMPEDVSDRPGRFSGNEEDLVGKELVNLLAIAPPEYRQGLKRYLGRWHEMRAVIALQRNRHRDCFRALASLVKFSSPTCKHVIIALLACLPGQLPSRAYQLFRAARNTRLPGGTDNGTP